MERMSEHTRLISFYQLLITAACTNTCSKMKGSHSRAADRCPFVPRHSLSQVTSFMQLGMLCLCRFPGRFCLRIGLLYFWCVFTRCSVSWSCIRCPGRDFMVVFSVVVWSSSISKQMSLPPFVLLEAIRHIHHFLIGKVFEETLCNHTYGTHKCAGFWWQIWGKLVLFLWKLTDYIQRR